MDEPSRLCSVVTLYTPSRPEAVKAINAYPHSLFSPTDPISLLSFYPSPFLSPLPPPLPIYQLGLDKFCWQNFEKNGHWKEMRIMLEKWASLSKRRRKIGWVLTVAIPWRTTNSTASNNNFEHAWWNLRFCCLEIMHALYCEKIILVKLIFCVSLVHGLRFLVFIIFIILLTVKAKKRKRKIGIIG